MKFELKNRKVIAGLSHCGTALALMVLLCSTTAYAKDIDYQGTEISVRVNPGEPTQLQFPGTISGGFKKKLSTLSMDKKGEDLIVFASDGISESGEAIIVRLDDGRSFSVRIQRANPDNPRDDVVRVSDPRGSMLGSSEEEEPAYKEKKFDYAPPNQISGFMREMILATEFGKASIPGYRATDKYRGETVLNDGTIEATIDRIFIGPNMWGYVINAKNLLDDGQRLNPATFRMDGTRAVSISVGELAGKPLTIEQQMAGKDKAKVYVITRAKRLN